MLPPAAANEVLKIKLSLEKSKNTQRWVPEHKGMLSVRSAYRILKKKKTNRANWESSNVAHIKKDLEKAVPK